MSSTYTIRKGDTLSALAKKFHTSVDALAQANGINDPNKIRAGATLVVPDKFVARADRSHAVPPSLGGQIAGDEFGKRPQSIEEGTGSQPRFDPRRAKPDDDQETTVSNARMFSDRAHPSFDTQDGYPIYRQGDAAWKHEQLGSRGTIGSQGCAMSSVAMAISGISGQSVTPEKMDKYMDSIHGYDGASIAKWDQMGKLVDPPVKVTREHNVGAARIDAELAKGRPVVIGVDYKATGLRLPGHDGKTDHWITVTGKNENGTYRANDPATGKAITLRAQADGRLVADNRAGNGMKYVSTGDAATFDRGAPRVNSTPRERPAVEPQAPVNGTSPSRGPGRGMNLASELSSPNSTLSVAIGNAEGNRTVNGGTTGSYGGHIDPGNRAHNLGTFSFQTKQDRNVSNAAEADAVQLRRLRGQIPAFEAACQKAGVDANNPRLQAAYFDLWNQSPNMAKRFLGRMQSQLGGKELSVENITKARVNSTRNAFGIFTSTGLKNPAKAYQDQLRRENALEAVLRHRGVV